jgi:hypothetical protein
MYKLDSLIYNVTCSANVYNVESAKIEEDMWAYTNTWHNEAISLTQILGRVMWKEEMPAHSRTAAY